MGRGHILHARFHFMASKSERSAFVPLCEQQEDDEATESQPTQEKVCCALAGKVNSRR